MKDDKKKENAEYYQSRKDAAAKDNKAAIKQLDYASGHSTDGDARRDRAAKLLEQLLVVDEKVALARARRLDFARGPRGKKKATVAGQCVFWMRAFFAVFFKVLLFGLVLTVLAVAVEGANAMPTTRKAENKECPVAGCLLRRRRKFD